uniref:Uncharacterized protein n=1 Tax=Cacopsylla melanoneura TaxID=428564 RepID=A0A8D8S0X6_9HEMI
MSIFCLSKTNLRSTRNAVTLRNSRLYRIMGSIKICFSSGKILNHTRIHPQKTKEIQWKRVKFKTSKFTRINRTGPRSTRCRMQLIFSSKSKHEHLELERKKEEKNPAHCIVRIQI